MGPEPWMRGHLAHMNPVVAAVLYAFEQADEDLTKHTADLDDAQIWMAFGEVAPVGFQLRHIAGSIDRLMTYAKRGQLSESQLTVLAAEKNRDLTKAQLLQTLRDSLHSASDFVRSVDPQQFGETRELGRKKIPVTLAGLLIHTAEHTQRHVGEAIVTAKLARASTPHTAS